MYQATTCSITVTVSPSYLEEESVPEDNHWFWAYTIEITNGSPDTVQLRSRYWHITDARGHVEEVNGAGVVGEEPILSPGDSFTYTSGCPLSTSSGIMRGHYRMETSDGGMITVEIPAFSLDVPNARRIMH
ncbi:Co2+/Mg2+ efflux protein ApaG [Consotaella salsifontis]|uniref:Protein ApaG n=1 Tax=Consotaella salsifontis TaxID=1365950 RepID=A0A1T4MK20_9HYPH|nr:Co2+/Mg2+ efflux protein ApaG [Consotaella salsifontis]SJZ67293.1 ApaG protein [Consotaella salsifontis]